MYDIPIYYRKPQTLPLLVGNLTPNKRFSDFRKAKKILQIIVKSPMCIVTIPI